MNVVKSMIPAQQPNEGPISLPPRRAFLQRTGTAALSVAAVAILAGCESVATGSSVQPADVEILNSAISGELEAMAAYQLCAETGHLQKPLLNLAIQFQGHHREHANLLASTVLKFGADPSSPKADYNFPVDKLKTQADVLRFAVGVEKGAISAYLSAVPLFDNRELAKAAASILGDEAMHLATLRNALGLDPVPSAFVS